jgi:hypothetical protein
MRFLPNIILLLSLLISCNSNDNATDKSLAKPVFNQAYNENYNADSIESILINANNAYVLVDPFMDSVANSVAQIKANGNEVGAYISIGTGENWRDDFTSLQPFLVSTPWEQWQGEYFVNTTTTGIIAVMKARIDKIANWGCDWVEFDNMDWIYDDDLRATYGYQVTVSEGQAYYQELCNYVHSKGMKCMAKNTVEAASDFDGVLYESYNNDKNWWDQSQAMSFINANKLVIINHYNETNCDAVYDEYKAIYGENLSYICEDVNLQGYKHYNL